MRNFVLYTGHGTQINIDNAPDEEVIHLLDGMWKETYQDKLDGHRLVDESTGKAYRVRVKYELEEIEGSKIFHRKAHLQKRHKPSKYEGRRQAGSRKVNEK